MNVREKIGRYSIQGRLGVGGMGAVFRAYDEELERLVALKQIRPEAAAHPQARARFLREARTAARLNHPSLVKTYDIVEDEHDLWIVMELVAGETLKARQVRQGRFDPGEVLELALEIARGLAAAHEAGIIHRDLKTENVIVTHEGQVKILDFGLAKPLWSVVGEAPLTATGQLLGTPRSMSPEQAVGRKVDHRSDLFSLGSLLYELVTATSPFLGANPRETLNRVVHHRQSPAHEAVPGVPRGLSELIDLLLRKDPAGRPQSAERVAAILERVADSPDDEIPVDELGAEGRQEGSGAGERRQVTVLCCDLGAVEASDSALDPQTLAHVMSEFQALAGEVIERYQGHVGNVLGHHVVVYFGYPRAHENDAQRAVYTAQELARRVEELNRRLKSRAGHGLAVRMGIHTGAAVVMAAPSHAEQLVLGETLDLATGLRTLAEPNQVVVSSATLRLIEGDFEVEGLPPAPLRGFHEPVVGHRVLQAKAAHSRWEVSRVLTPLVARDQELGLLVDRWRQAKEGRGQVVLLSGEAGIGKSRLLRTLEEHLAPETPRWLMAQASPYAQSTPLQPILELLRRVFELRAQDPHRQQLQELEKGLRRYGLPPAEAVPLLASLLSLPVDDSYPPLGLAPRAQRSKTLETIVTLLREMSQRHPTVLLVEDLHWIDPSTVELLSLILDQVEAFPLLLVLTFRLDFEPPWEGGPHVTQLNLHRLTADEARDLMRRVSGGKALPEEVERQIIAKTDGVPLFVEEIVKGVLESGLVIEVQGRYELAEPLRPFDIPATLRDSLTARLDRLGTAKEVAQLGAVVGREFSQELLSVVSQLKEGALKRALDRLVAAELVHRKGFGSRRRYLFKHALIQDAAYDSLLKPQRQRHHERIAVALEEHFSDTARSQPELVAHHYTEAGLGEPAVKYWQQAADSAVKRSANLEAIDHGRRGLSIVKELSDTPQRVRQELDLQTLLGQSLTATRGFTFPEVRQCYERARQLCREIGDVRKHFWVLQGIGRFHMLVPELQKSLQIGRELLELAGSQKDSDLVVEARELLGGTCFYLGNPDAADEHMLAGIHTHSQGSRARDSTSVMDGTVASMAYMGLIRWQRGYAEQAARWSRQAIALARKIAHPFSLGFALHFSAILHQLLRDAEQVKARASQVVRLSEEKGFIWTGLGNLLLGWALAAAHDVAQPDPPARPEEGDDDGVALMKSGLAKWRASGAGVGNTYFLSMKAETYIRRGRIDDARRVLEEAFALVVKGEEHYWEAELHRYRGELALVKGRLRGAESVARREAEGWFLKALEIAGRQGAKFHHLRAARELARLWQRDGNRRQAREVLAQAYGWFGEGFDTVDLKEARAVLDQLP